MKARESKKARELFSKEKEGRTLLRKIYDEAKKGGLQHINTTVRIGQRTIRVSEL